MSTILHTDNPDIIKMVKNYHKTIELLKELQYNLGKAMWQWENPIERGYELSNQIEEFLKSIEE